MRSTDAGYRLGDDVAIACDPASTEFFRDGTYHLDGKQLTSSEMVDTLEQLVADYRIVSIEDGLSEEDWDGWAEYTKRLGSKTQLVGDDLLCTNKERIAKAVELGCANALLVKVNQIGTLTGTLDAIDMAKRAGWRCMMSHRSGETEDITIAHLAVATGSGQIKAGATVRGERTAKFNELMRIEEALGAGARYLGTDAFGTKP